MQGDEASGSVWLNPAPSVSAPQGRRAPPEFLDVEGLETALLEVAGRAGLEREVIGRVEDLRAPSGSWEIAAWRWRRPGPVTAVAYVSAGIHGDEPAGPLAVLELVRAGRLAEGVEWVLLPALNPHGLVRGRREGSTGADLNRDFRNPACPETRLMRAWVERQPVFDAAVCLHEDWEAAGFYLYELGPDRGLGVRMRDAAARAGPLEAAAQIDGRPVAETAILRPEGNPSRREQWPESLFLASRGVPAGFTVETASIRPIGERVAQLVAAVEALGAGISGGGVSRRA